MQRTLLKPVSDAIVSPLVVQLESAIIEHPLVQDCLVIGEDQAYLSALIAPDKNRLYQQLRAEKTEGEIRLDNYLRLNDIDIRALYCDLLESVNARFPDNRIERFALMEIDTSKSRDVFLAEKKPIVDSLYQDYIPGIG